AARGIGLAVAERLAEAGAAVHGFDARPPETEPSCCRSFTAVDITDASAVADAVAAIADPVTILVNNAGITRDRSLLKMSDEDWAAVINVNLSGAFNMIRAVAPRIIDAGGGAIVNITSINGLRGKFGQANYAASKAGLIGLTKTAARELGRKGVRVNAVAPGMVLTEMALALPAEFRDRALAEAVLPDLAEPVDIANAVLFLASDAGRMVTGQVLPVDSGQYI
ncbi:MAG: SDR family oxidoreductase, partial [Hyphomicrobiales bacterium]|nr:SDR family oxidoreductase [Hyphomicrobiales bacterium]